MALSIRLIKVFHVGQYKNFAFLVCDYLNIVNFSVIQ